jgi:SAM-dependent methyltransferase
VTSPFDDFAWFYDRYIASGFEQWLLPVLDRIFIPHLPPRARILDLCCGTGNLASRLAGRGYRVLGLDGSHGMLQIAKAKAPGALFAQSDATAFALKQPVDAAISVFDSLSHLLTRDDLLRAFQSVHAALAPSGLFLFDINTRAAYGDRWDQTWAEVQPDHAFFLRGKFDREAQLGHTRVTMFQLNGTWKRADVELCQRPWELEEVEPLLRSAGFREIAAKRPQEDLGIEGHYGIGRVYLSARK